MENEISKELLNDVEAHTIALVRREQDLNRKLISTELLMKRYQVLHSLSLLFLRSHDAEKTKKEFLDYLISSMHFQKVILLSTISKFEVNDCRGYLDEESNRISTNKEEIIKSINKYFENSLIEFDSLYIDDSKESETLFGLNSFLIGKAHFGDGVIYILSGFDLANGSIFKSKYPLSIDDISWFIQLVVLWSSFLERTKLFEELNAAVASSLLLAEQREKQIEERTRALLDALFDAKKFKLALELADAVVLLVDASSHKIIYANELFEKISGYKRDKFVGRKTLEFLKLIPLDRGVHLFSPSFDLEIKNTNVFRGRFIFISEGGVEHELVLSISRFAEEGGGSVFVVIGRDVTSERNIVKQEQKYAEDIKKLNQLIVNRELRIIELKQRIAGLIK